MKQTQMSKRETARTFFVHTPEDLSQSYVQYARRIQSEPGIQYGCVLDKFIRPLRPGDVMAVVARPGHGKSSWMAYIARKTALDIAARSKQNGSTPHQEEAVVYVTWEQTVEEIEAFFQSGKEYSSTDMAWGRVPIEKIERGAVKRGRLPVWMFGESKRHEGIRRPKMTIDYVYEAIEAMQEEYGVRPALMCMDYVQLMPLNETRRKQEQVDEAINNAKQLAMRLGLPIIIGVQARRDVDAYKNPIPTLADAQWASAIEQVADIQLGLWRPIKTHDPVLDPKIKVGGAVFDNHEDLFVIRLLKQRFDAGYGTFAVRFRPQTLEVWDYDVSQQR